MAAPGGCSLSAAFQEYLRHLGLQDFPCGLGSWNKSCPSGRRSPRRGQPGQEEAVLDEETPEALLELLRDQHSPWALPQDCSPQDRLLREVAVLAPELIRGSKVCQVLRSLRMVDKGGLRDTLAKPSSLQVEEVDEGVLQFQQLEELILSANQISRITSANLPRTLKVLELCCNTVGDLEDLCSQPPPELQHLGLGHNRLCGPSQDKFLTGDFWPNLISLDLSFNSLTDLLGLVSQLATLQKLRILVLQGNPLALIPTYRGFLVDSLPKLSLLDDIYVGPDERQQFRGLARQPELSRSEARVVVSVGEMKGVPDPSALQQLEVGSEAPVITCSYFVTYEFPEGEEEFVEEEELEDESNTEVTKTQQSPKGSMLDVDSSAQDTGETKNQQDPAATEEPKAHSARVFATPGMPWADTIDCSYTKEHIAKDLVGLMSYLAAGTVVSVVEEKHPGSRDKKKKQQQQQPRELRSDPPILRTLGTTRVTLEALLATEDLVETVCDFGVLITEKPPEAPIPEEKDEKKGKDKNKKAKAEGRAGQKTSGLPKVREPGAGKGKNKDTAELEEGQGLQPVPLVVQFQMQLLRWPLAVGAHSRENEAVEVEKTQ
ncbi:leucine-rich repeat-containing protein 43 [Pitangus sulphuratus]|nr:leucine-rich repeat-containing protein 43 [Pitangus sulphuratus]